MIFQAWFKEAFLVKGKRNYGRKWMLEIKFVKAEKYGSDEGLFSPFRENIIS